MNHIDGIEAGLKAKAAYSEIARKIFLTYPTAAFIGAEEQQYQVLNSIAHYFEIPITTIHVAGSAKTGRSFHQNLDFVPGASDLDVAIIDARLFIKYSEIVYSRSKRYSDQSLFPVKEGKSTYEEYASYLLRGIFRPDLMTTGAERAGWNNYFGKLSSEHSNLFRSITACVYLSELFFQGKQRSAIKCYSDGRPV
jgi:hypothetical protein